MHRHHTIALASLFLGAAALADNPHCQFSPAPTDLQTRAGYVDFMSPSELAPFKAALPQVADAETQAVLSSPDTMWYDEKSMVFSYQDSIEVVVGVRANCVGRVVGEENVNNPGIAKLLNLFGPDYKFLFPFRKAAGTDNVSNVHVLNFWSPARNGSSVLPVEYWRAQSRGHYYWTFPNGTMIGEALFEAGPDGRWYPFEIRTRTRYEGGWAVNLFRPFVTAESLAKAIEAERPVAQQTDQLKAFLAAVRNPATLVPHRMESTEYAAVFQPIDGALDPLPSMGDDALVAKLLSQTLFVSAEGMIWKQQGKLETYAPASNADFSIVPKGYEMGMIPVNEVSCNRCHTETSRNLGQFEPEAVLYGEIWGEDRIFTWHPFQASQYIFQTWDEADSPTRTINPRLTQAGLVRNQKPSGADSHYSPLPSAFVPDFYRAQKDRR